MSCVWEGAIWLHWLGALGDFIRWQKVGMLTGHSLAYMIVHVPIIYPHTLAVHFHGEFMI